MKAGDDFMDIAMNKGIGLNFGTGGLRAIMGPAENQINKKNIQLVTLGLGYRLLDKFQGEAKKRGVCVAYDSRHNSKYFAEITAEVLSQLGIKAFLFDRLVPTPELSFAVGYLNCVAGVVITASHNPKEYNSYKVYNEFGGQMVPHEVAEVKRFIDRVNDKDIAKEINRKNIFIIPDEVHRAFYKAILKESLIDDKSIKSQLNIVYTPIHGAGNIPVRAVLAQDGFTNVYVVSEEEQPNGDFPTVVNPNPEEKTALKLGIQLAKEQGADIVLGTDPDCDRVGIAIYHKGEYQLLTGNQIGALLVYFVLEQQKSKKKLNHKSTLIKTIVTGELGESIAKDFNVSVVNTLTGFKYIGEQIINFEKEDNLKNEFVIGYEESYGYLIGSHCKDKDAVVACMIISEMAAYYKNQGLTLIDMLNNIYIKYGYYLDQLDSYSLKNKKEISRIMAEIKQFNILSEAMGPSFISDYNMGIEGLPKENVIKVKFIDDSWFAVRPSGTEPKIKFYYSIKAGNDKGAQIKYRVLREEVRRVAKL